MWSIETWEDISYFKTGARLTMSKWENFKGVRETKGQYFLKREEKPNKSQRKM